MNYFVVSPNVYNDGDVQTYIDEMFDRHIVIMGYSKEDKNKWVNMFCNTMRIGDCVIVARGANWQKQVFFAGIISSDTMPYTDSGESMYREINFFTILPENSVPFNTKCAFGASRCPQSIYQLKPSRNKSDKDVSDTVSSLIASTILTQSNRKDSFSLREISRWELPQSKVAIPGIQRGLVWKPAQVELLWDSILRGFPIGTFTLSEKNTSTDKGSPEEKKLYLMDGQQRFNSIALGFKDIRNINCEKYSMLWLDIAAEIPQNSTRSFLIRVTTSAHPWGYDYDDSCSKLKTETIREFLKTINRKESIYNKPLTLNESYPYCSEKPIPLVWLLNAPTVSADAFYEYIHDKIIYNTENQRYKLPFSVSELSENDIKKLKNDLFPVFKHVKQYQVGVNYITAETLDNSIEDTEDANRPAALETLFRRIGTGGTQITQEELDYSAIKAYWPDWLQIENDKIANKYMPPERLVKLVFRLILTLIKPESKQFKDVSINLIRAIGKSKESDCFDSIHNREYEEIKKWYSTEDNSESKICQVMQTVDTWLLQNNCPKILRTSIARKSPDVYLLLMYFASQQWEQKLTANPDVLLLIQAVAYYIHWFVEDKNKSKVVDSIFYHFDSKSPEQSIKKGIGDAIYENIFPILIRPDQISMDIKQEPIWRPYYPEAKWWHTWNKISYNKELLLFAEREYVNKKFANYDPADKGMWEQHNRPWDMDHIIPQHWISRKQCKYREYCKEWLWLNGNFAAISFEANRSKNDNPDWNEYEENKESLMYSDGITTISTEVTSNKEQAIKFAKLTYNRTIEIYQRCYSLLGFERLLQNIPIEDLFLKQRKELIIEINTLLKSKCLDSHIYWVDDISSRHEFEIESDTDSNWFRKWITVGFVMNNDYYICICLNNNTNIEIGVRKSPNSQNINKDKGLPQFESYQTINSDWWYVEKDISIEKCSVDSIVAELLRLKEEVEKSI